MDDTVLTNRDGESVEPPPNSLSREVYLQWRSPRFGKSNPERLNNPAWLWAIQSGLNAYQINEYFRGPSSFDEGPGWCFDRFGQSCTHLEDGRIIFIGGEHEDYYDPDFKIYNDVVVKHPDGRIDIFGYPPEVFPPTDFHSATLVEDKIFIIGTLGYTLDRVVRETPVAVLSLEDFSISKIKSLGTPPGWIHSHVARLSEDQKSLVIQLGKLIREDPNGSFIDNIDDWNLSLADYRWERLTKRDWRRCEVLRIDRKRIHLFEYEMERFNEKHAVYLKPTEATIISNLPQLFPSLKQQLGTNPDFEVFAKLYIPVVKHEIRPEIESEHRIHRIAIDGVVVRFVAGEDSIQMTVEGELLESTVESIAGELRDKLAVLENSPCEIVQI